MSDLSNAAAAMGIPEPLVQRAAAARAAETGASVEEILAAWAGGEAAPAAAVADEPAGEDEASAADTPAVEEPEAEVEPEVVPETAPQPAAAAAAVRAPAPEEVTLSQLGTAPVVVTVPTAGIKERTNFAIPKWLASVLLIAPIFALFALGGASTGECGEGTELAVDVVTGRVVNCDGSEFTGEVIGDDGVDFIALGGDIFSGVAVSGINCAGCHMPDGSGGVGPPTTGVLTTFRACVDQIEWVEKGSRGFVDEGRSTYGDTGKSIAGGMPSHPSLTQEQIAAVSAYVRVRHAGGDRDEVLADCGLAEPEENGEDGEPTEDGEEDQPPDQA